MKVFMQILAIFALVNGATQVRASEPFVISLERTGCKTECPEYKVSIFADGKVEFEGKASVKALGIRKGRIGQKEMAKFLNEVCVSGYFDLKPRYLGRPIISHLNDEWLIEQETVSDASAVITEITVGSLHQRVENYGTGPAWLTEIEKKIDRLATSSKWIR
jgi:hypothetical protein